MVHACSLNGSLFRTTVTSKSECVLVTYLITVMKYAMPKVKGRKGFLGSQFVEVLLCNPRQGGLTDGASQRRIVHSRQRLTKTMRKTHRERCREPILSLIWYPVYWD